LAINLYRWVLTVYALRIVKPEWVSNVYRDSVYYGSIRRNFKPGDTILFFSKVEGLGDALIGYGVVESFHMREYLPEDEASKFQDHPWRWLIKLNPSHLVKLDNPIPWVKLVEHGVIPENARGRYLHGYRLKDREIDILVRLIPSLTSYVRYDV